MNEATLYHIQLNELCIARRFEEAGRLALYLIGYFEDKGPDYSIYVIKYSNYLAEIFRYWGKYRSALLVNQHILEIWSFNRPPNSPEIASTLQKIGNVYLKTGNYSRSLFIHKRALKIRRRVLKKNDPDIAVTLNNMAEIYRNTGLLEKSILLNKEAIKIRIHAYGKVHAETAASLNNFAATYLGMGHFKKALSAYRKALDIRKAAHGEIHPDVAQSFNNLATVHHIMGNYIPALNSYTKALETLNSCHQPPQELLASTLNNFGSLHQAIGNLDIAEDHYLKSLSIREAIFKESHPDIANSLNNLGGLYKAKKYYQRAQSKYSEALDMRKALFKGHHPDIGTTCNNIAGLYQTMGSPDKALPHYKEALSISEKTLGRDHHATGNILNNLASVYQALDDPQKALELSEEALTIQDSYIHNIFDATVPEKQKLSCLRSLSQYLDGYLALVNRSFNDDPSVLKKAFEWAINRKGLVLDIHSNAQESILSKLSENDQKIWKKRQQTMRQLSALLLSPLESLGMTLNTYQSRKSSLQSRVEELESRLYRAGVTRYKDIKPEIITLESICAGLPGKTTFLEFVKFRDFDYKGEWINPEFRYLVFVLNPNKQLRLIDLGPASKIESISLKALKSIHSEIGSGEKRSSTPKRMQAEKSFHALSKLYDVLWKPIQEHTKFSDRILISPDGTLNLIPFSALVDTDETHLIEKHTISHLASSRELVSVPKKVSQSSNDLLLLADPDFGLTAENESFQSLEGTRLESEQIQAALLSKYPRQIVLEKKDATKSKLLTAESSKIIHLATHGFFLDDLTEKDPYDNPLLRSGLVLANTDQPNGRDDYERLTALEITGMNLQGTELVVLSACSTGFGTIQNGEGVFGLRRAFHLAGAKTLVMSLWNISDKETPAQIQSFYKNYLTMPPAEALRQAQLNAIKELKEDYGYAAVSLWAPFIVQGARS